MKIRAFSPLKHQLLPLVKPALTSRGLKVGLLLLFDGLRVIVSGAFMHGQRGDLLVGFAAVVAVVRLARRVDHMVFVETRVFREALLAARDRAHVRLLTWRETRGSVRPRVAFQLVSKRGGSARLTCVYPHVVLVVGGAGERAPAAGLGAVVRPLAGVRPDVNLADVGGGERPATTFDRAFKRLLSCRQETGSRRLKDFIINPAEIFL